MFQMTKQYFESICTAVAESRTGHSEQLYQKMITYMDEHYYDSMFNLATMADHLQLNARSEEHTSELQSLMRISYAVFCLKKKTENQQYQYTIYISKKSH